VIGVSTDFIATLNHWAKELSTSFPLASDHDGKVAKDYGVLLPNRRMANRATFVIDPEGKIVEIVEGSAAIDPTGAETACSRVNKKT
jgi:peroxiredoxin Q/BCP